MPPPPSPLKLPDFFFMTSHRDSHTTTDVKPEMIPSVYTGNWIPHDKYDVHGIAHARTDRKDNIFMQRRLYIDKTQTALNIFPTTTFIVLVTAKAL